MKTRGFVIILSLILAMAAIAYAEPNGAQVTAGTPETMNMTDPGNVTAQGGNTTEVDLSTKQKTLAWQGFFGDVSGNLTLEDNSGDQMYNWVISNIAGEVYASRNSSIDWTTVAGITTCTVDEDLTGTGTDRTNNTFTNNASLSGWDVGGVAIAAACQTYTLPLSNFEEIILSATGVTSIYATKINAGSTGFDGGTYDYQMIVADNKTTATSTYYFYVEFD